MAAVMSAVTLTNIPASARKVGEPLKFFFFSFLVFFFYRTSCFFSMLNDHLPFFQGNFYFCILFAKVANNLYNPLKVPYIILLCDELKVIGLP